MLTPLDHLFGETVVEVLVHLADELVVVQRGKVEVFYFALNFFRHRPNHPRVPRTA